MCRPVARALSADEQAKHGISFADAITAFDDLFALVASDAAHSTPREERRWWIGESDSGVLVVVFTVRQPGDARIERSGNAMPRAKSFPFEKARRVTARETEAARKAIEKNLGTERPWRGHPPKGVEKYQAVSIRLSPKALAWACKGSDGRKTCN